MQAATTLAADAAVPPYNASVRGAASEARHALVAAREELVLDVSVDFRPGDTAKRVTAALFLVRDDREELKDSVVITAPEKIESVHRVGSFLRLTPFERSGAFRAVQIKARFCVGSDAPASGGKDDGVGFVVVRREPVAVAQVALFAALFFCVIRLAGPVGRCLQVNELAGAVGGVGAVLAFVGLGTTDLVPKLHLRPRPSATFVVAAAICLVPRFVQAHLRRVWNASDATTKVFGQEFKPQSSFVVWNPEKNLDDVLASIPEFHERFERDDSGAAPELDMFGIPTPATSIRCKRIPWAVGDMLSVDQGFTAAVPPVDGVVPVHKDDCSADDRTDAWIDLRRAGLATVPAAAHVSWKRFRGATQDEVKKALAAVLKETRTLSVQGPLVVGSSRANDDLFMQPVPCARPSCVETVKVPEGSVMQARSSFSGAYWRLDNCEGPLRTIHFVPATGVTQLEVDDDPQGSHFYADASLGFAAFCADARPRAIRGQAPDGQELELGGDLLPRTPTCDKVKVRDGARAVLTYSKKTGVWDCKSELPKCFFATKEASLILLHERECKRQVTGEAAKSDRRALEKELASASCHPMSVPCVR